MPHSSHTSTIQLQEGQKSTGWVLHCFLKTVFFSALQENNVLILLCFMYWSYSVLRSLSGHNARTSSYQLVPLFLLLHSNLHLNDHVSQSVSFSATPEHPPFYQNTIHTMILLIEKRPCGWNEHLHQVGHFADDTESTEDGLQAHKK